MSWRNIRLVFLREVRDQLRDRRTIFMIAVLPLFFYPLLGMALFQATNFLKTSPSEILIVGQEPIEGVPPLIENGRFSPQFFADPSDSERLHLQFRAGPDGEAQGHLPTSNPDEWNALVTSGEVQAVVYFPADFAARMEQYRVAVRQRLENPQSAGEPLPEAPCPEFVYDSGQEKSELAFQRVSYALRRWAEAIGQQNLRESRIPEYVASPRAFESTDLASLTGRVDAKLWAKILPFVLVMWAVTGAFYPAVDLCAGEKERGTLETLLCSPAARGDIVVGKLLTVMLFSMATAILNLVSMGITGTLVLEQLHQLPNMAGSIGVAPPTFAAAAWSLVALVPVSAFFSAVCLALAAFARSTKEGQYYLMPVILITMPLIVLPMAPTAELTLGTSLIPVTGIVLTLRSLIEGTFAKSWPLAIPVVASTLLYCVLAIRWAIEQFNSENVLFRAGDRWSVSSWLRHLLRDREATPTVAMAVMCGFIILVLRFVLSFAMPQISLSDMRFVDLAKISVITQMVVVLTPALLMTVMLTRSPKATLQLGMPHWLAVPLAALLAVAMHPLVISLRWAVDYLYPAPEMAALNHALARILGEAPSIWWALLIIAVLPALCEEIAFRGFILSGLRHLGHKWRAIVISSIFFGVSHGILQQSIIATIIGCLIGYLAVQTGSLWTGVAYHLVHNGLMYSVSRLDESQIEWAMWTVNGEAVSYSPLILLVSALLVLRLLMWFHALPYRRTQEEALQEKIDHDTAQAWAP